MLRLPQMVGTLTLVAAAAGALATADAFATPAPPTPLVCPDPSEPPAGPPGATRTNDEFMGNTTFQRAMTDVLRLGIAVRFCELRPDTLTLDAGEGGFHVALDGLQPLAPVRGVPLADRVQHRDRIELRYHDRVVGWYTVGGLTWTEKPKRRRVADSKREVAAEGEEPTRSGFHFNAGAGAGAFDQQCRGCGSIMRWASRALSLSAGSSTRKRCSGSRERDGSGSRRTSAFRSTAPWGR